MSAQVATLGAQGSLGPTQRTMTWAAYPAIGCSLNHDLHTPVVCPGRIAPGPCLRETPMFYLAFGAAARIYVLLQQYAPTNLLVAWLRRRENLTWGVPFMLLGAACSWPPP